MINSSETEPFWQIDRFRLRDYNPGVHRDGRGWTEERWFIGPTGILVRYINSLTIGIVIAVIAFIYQYRR